MESLFGRYEAAALLAVEQANGGELAPLEQVIVSFEGLFGSSVAASTFAESLALLVDAGLIDWKEHALELTLDGRRTIRRSGSHWDHDFPDKVAARLSKIEEDDLSPEGELPCPTEHDILGAMQSLGRGRLDGSAQVPGEEIAPSGMAGHQTLGARLMVGLPLGYGIRVDVPGVSSAPLGAKAPPPAPRAAPPIEPWQFGTGGGATHSVADDPADSPPMVAPLEDEPERDDH